MSANPPKNDSWRPYADVRFVLIRNAGRLKPSRGLILDWKREGRHWEALVVWHDDASELDRAGPLPTGLSFAVGVDELGGGGPGMVEGNLCPGALGGAWRSSGTPGARRSEPREGP